jgi:hypothetical protein
VPARGRKHVELDAADEQRVGRLFRAEPLEVALAGRPLRLDDLAGAVGRGARVADLALPDEVGQRAEGLLDVGVGLGAVDLVEVDVVGAEAPQRALDRGEIQQREPPRRLGSSPIGMENFVARTTSSRRPLSALPTISSDSPAE